MEAYMESDKRMTAKEAIERFVRDGDSFVIANCLTGMPLALVHELIRAGRRRLLLFHQGGIEEVDLLLAGGAIDRLVLAYNLRMGGRGWHARRIRAHSSHHRQSRVPVRPGHQGDGPGKPAPRQEL